ncbi:hypothetical protein GGS20DRAFT_598912 [Poronia punctata]|nr:hypothetical protein GGS20DRAFT_598912 [Poronia punctata]
MPLFGFLSRQTSPDVLVKPINYTADSKKPLSMKRRASRFFLGGSHATKKFRGDKSTILQQFDSSPPLPIGQSSAPFEVRARVEVLDDDNDYGFNAVGEEDEEEVFLTKEDYTNNDDEAVVIQFGDASDNEHYANMGCLSPSTFEEDWDDMCYSLPIGESMDSQNDDLDSWTFMEPEDERSIASILLDLPTIPLGSFESRESSPLFDNDFDQLPSSPTTNPGLSTRTSSTTSLPRYHGPRRRFESPLTPRNRAFSPKVFMPPPMDEDWGSNSAVFDNYGKDY